MNSPRRTSGFTLVELLVVVAVIGILAAVLTPQFLNARKVAVDRAVEAYIQNVYTVVQSGIAVTGEAPGDVNDAPGEEFLCTDGYAWGNFTVPSLNQVGGEQFACTVFDNGALVVAYYEGGTKLFTGIGDGADAVSEQTYAIAAAVAANHSKIYRRN